MESDGQKFDRLLTALEVLFEEEAVMIGASDYSAAAEVQKRANPLVDALANLAPRIKSTAARTRLDSLLQRRQESLGALESKVAAARTELEALQQSSQRVARIAPVYGRASHSIEPGRFRASG
jgi:type VI protein secretion system component VasF